MRTRMSTRARNMAVTATAAVALVVGTAVPASAATIWNSKWIQGSSEWRTCSIMQSGEKLTRDEGVACGGFSIVHQSDGNVVFTGLNNTHPWATGTNGQATTRIEMQTDGNLVLYNNDTPLWWSGTSERGSVALLAGTSQSIRFMVMAPNGVIKWESPAFNA